MATRYTLLAGLLLMAPAPAALAQTPGIQDALEKKLQAVRELQGGWKVELVERNGAKAREDDDLKNLRVVIEGNKWTNRYSGENGRTQSSTFTLDPDKKPKAVDFVADEGPAKDKRSLGIYELDGDTLKVCFDNTGRGGDRPTEFKTTADSGRTLFVFKRQKK
jgi:uncharacterized protein (TIGR03067 family)